MMYIIRIVYSPKTNFLLFDKPLSSKQTTSFWRHQRWNDVWLLSEYFT